VVPRIGAFGHQADGRVHHEQTDLKQRRFKPGADIVGGEFETISKNVVMKF
jgi:hypothetical protein